MDENKVLNENTANSVPKKKNTLKTIVIALVIAVAATGGAFYYSVNKHIPITPSPAEIISEDELTVMTDEEVTADTLAVEVKSDVDLSLVDMPETKTVFGFYECPAIYDIKDFKYEVTYSSSDESIFTIETPEVSEKGEDHTLTPIIIPVNTGEAELVITSGEVSKTVNVTVKKYVSPSEMPETVEVVKDKNVAVVNELGEYEVLKADFTIEDTDKAIISEDGIITGVNQGETILKTIAGDKEFETSIKVLQPVTNLEVSAKSVYVGNTVKSNVGLVPNTADYGTSLTYKSSDTSVAKVNETGTITGVKVGKATITVTSEEGIIKDFTVTVSNKPVAQTTAAAPTTNGGGSNSGSSAGTSNSASAPVTSTNVLSDEQIRQIVADGNDRAKSLGVYDPNAPNYGVDSNVQTSGKPYEQSHSEVMALVDKWSYSGQGYVQVFNIGRTIIVAHG